MSDPKNDAGTSQPKAPAKDPKKKGEEDLSEEDLASKQQLELYVERVQDSDPGLQKVVLESMRRLNQIRACLLVLQHETRTSTSSMTSVPKPLKFLRPHYGTLKSFYETMRDSDMKKYLADILSVLALTMSAEGERESLKYRLLGSEGDIGSWGHEYVRRNFTRVYQATESEEAPIEDLMELVQQIVSFHMKHNAEPEAVDLLMEVEDLDLLLEHVDKTNFKRTCLYLTSAARLVVDIAYTIYMKFEEFASALQIALSLDNMQHMRQVFTSCDDQLKMQFCYILARHACFCYIAVGITFELDDEMVADDDDREALQDIINNTKLSESYLTLVRDIEVMEPKSPEDIYKALIVACRHRKRKKNTPFESSLHPKHGSDAGFFQNRNRSRRKNSRLPISDDSHPDKPTNERSNLSVLESWFRVSGAYFIVIPNMLVAPSLPLDPSHHDEVRTIFIMGLPEDVKERELQNLLRWLPGFEASQVNYKGGKPMGFALFSNAKFAFAAKDALQETVFDAKSKSLLHIEMAKKNLLVKGGIVKDSDAYDPYGCYPVPLVLPMLNPAPVAAPSIYVPVQAGCCDDKSVVDVVHDGTKESTTKRYCNDKSCEVARIGRIRFNNLWKEGHPKQIMDLLSQHPFVVNSLVPSWTTSAATKDCFPIPYLSPCEGGKPSGLDSLSAIFLAKKAHLLDDRAGASVDSARQNLAATFVNAFVNAGFSQDKLMTAPSDSSIGGSTGNWLFKNKEHGKTSVAASLGMILLWDVDSGLAQIYKYFHSNDNHVIAGALLGVGIVNCGVKNDSDPALTLLSEYISKEDSSVRIGAIMVLGIAYAGAQNEQIHSSLTPILNDAKAPLNVIAFTAISLGLIYVGSCNEEVAQAIIFALMDRSESELGKPLTRLLPLALGLLYLGKHESVEATAEVSKMFNEKIRKYCDMTLLSCAYAGTGNVLKVQNLLGHCAQHLEKGETHQGPAYGEQNIRRAVPLALGLLCISNPKVNVMDTLSRLSHDSDSEVAMAAVISLGLIGGGTNNARTASMLRNLSSYYYKDANLLFCVRIAQGLVHLGKGLLTVNPYHSDRFLLAPTALAGLVTILHACLDMKAMPRMLMTVDENHKLLPVPVRVGQAVDVVGQAGQPKTITGFQTHSRYIPLSPILEVHVILKENPEYREDS
ncbi:26S proteasome non-ATPase regulatory subunit 2-like protein B [Hibiscus syriacus]|uniref:26S proteasome non-ATPase regulatory subunit 2-like protein B n=1 Tax=Hibiscus syriacus TaxID=106335 RepID=A0A6A2YCX5_HIBSY|nr:26S proteasome non-ATPase regulatory subunit 2-like protein B [Hibiscus syriacus]